MNNKKTLIRIAVSLLMFVVLTGCFSNAEQPETTTAPLKETTTAETTTETIPETTTAYVEPVTIDLVSIGDMLMHTSASTPALQTDGTYQYDYLFAQVKDKLQSADLATVNNEVIMAGNDIGNVGYPEFNVRTELGDAEYNAGIDVVLMATNHTMDQDAAGILNAIQYWKTAHPDMTYLGVHSSAEEAAAITVKDVNGIKIAMLNYTYGLNGFEVPAGMDYVVDLMNDSTKDKIASDIAKAKTLADFVIVFPHWGTEYNLGISDAQKAWAQFFADQGVNLIIGTHPHVVEPVETLTGVNGNSTLVYYSLGNFVSIQYYNYSMLGGMADVTITKDSTGTYVSSYDMDFLVTHYTPDRSVVTTYFLDQYTDALASTHSILTEPGEEYAEANKAYPFTVASLKALAEKICPDLADY